MRKSSDTLVIENLTVGHTPDNQLFPPFTESLGEGELISVVGKNGTGKSTLLLTLAGLLPEISGNIRIYGEPLNKLNGEEVARRIAFVSTEKIKAGGMKVADLVALGRYPHTGWFGKLNQRDYEIIKQSLERVGIADLAGRNISELSDGERQKATIARAIAQETSILIMDEPTAFLDISAKYGIASLMRELAKSGKTVIFSTHDLNIAIEQSDKIWLVSESGVVEGAPEDLMISDSFSTLFDTKMIVYDPSGYRVLWHQTPTSLIYLEGEGPLFDFTSIALKRVGFEITDKKSIPYIKIFSGLPACWSIEYSDKSSHHYSIHSLLSDLRSYLDPEPEI
jgi:iron complex transport system ATP-binding protein